MCASGYTESSYISVTIPSTTDFEFTLSAPMHEIRWRSSDKGVDKTKHVGTSSEYIGHRHHATGHLSSGSIAAISVCVTLAMLALIVIAVLLFRRRMQRSRMSAQMELVAVQQSALPEVYTDADKAKQLGDIGPLQSVQSPSSFQELPKEAAPRYEAEDTSPLARNST